MFRKIGLISFGTQVDEDAVLEAAMEAGADDVIANDDGSVDVTTNPETYLTVKEALLAAGFTPENAAIMLHADIKTALDAEAAEKMLKLIDRLEDLDDVQDVYSNADISDEIMAGIEIG
jgi:transcriptional/translational regulatory protein YebC/TACO1